MGSSFTPSGFGADCHPFRDHSSVVDSGDSLNAPQSHTIEVHFQPQLLNIVRIFPIAIVCEELAVTMLAFVAQSVSMMTILIEIA
jgi:tetrahydromethanopterin S-methyltransferase subunit E